MGIWSGFSVGAHIPGLGYGVHHLGLFIINASECLVEKEYQPNGRFRIVGDVDKHTNGSLKFKINNPPNRALLRDYRSVYGWGFAHGALIYANTAHNLSLALYRMMSAREPERIGYDRELRENQNLYINNNYRHMLDNLHFITTECHYQDMRTAAEELTRTPHPKLKLRQQAFDKLSSDGGVADKVWLRNMEWKMKRLEFAKAGKIPRVICDLGVAASLQGAPVMGEAKHFLGDKFIEVNDCAYFFCTNPLPDYVAGCFKRLLDHKYRALFLVFSDDCCVSFDGGKTFANFDISSCDTSHESILFELMFDALAIPEEIRVAMKLQMLANIIIRNPDDPAERITLKPTEYYLQTGSTMTTLINSFSWFVIFHCYATSRVTVLEAAHNTGYIVTEDPCSKMEHIQFLKMSPMRDVDGEIRAVLNLGVILRASGTCKGDLPGSGDLERRAAHFQSLVMTGLTAGFKYDKFTEPLMPIKGLARPKSEVLAQFSSALAFTYDAGVKKYEFNSESFYQRYDATQDEIDDFENMLSALSFGYVMDCALSRRILLKDYSLGHAEDIGEYKEFRLRPGQLD